jgi:hypothetical protein
MSDDKRVKVLTPKAVASYPRLNEPTKFVGDKSVVCAKNDTDASYEIEVILEADDAAEIIGPVQPVLDEFVAEKRAELAAGKPEQKKKAKAIETLAIGRPELDSEGEETGRVKLRFKMKAAFVSKKNGELIERRPVVFDAQSPHPLKVVPKVGGGSIVRVAGLASPYYRAVDNACGIAWYLDAVQIIELREFGTREASAFGFGEESGYTAQPPAPATPFDDSDADDSSSGDTGDDF